MTSCSYTQLISTPVLCLSALIGISACATDLAVREQSASPESTAGPTELDFGNYVAGRFAGHVRDRQAGNYYLQALQADPDNPLLLSRAFTLLLIEGRMKDAERMAARLAERPYGSSTADLLLAISAFRRNAMTEATAIASEMGGTGFESLIAPILKAWLAAKQGQTEDAIDALAPLGVIRGLKPFQDAHTAYILDYLNETARAEVAYQAVIDSDRLNSLQPVIAYAAMLQRLGRDDEALSLFDRFMQEFTGNEFLERARDQLLKGRKLRPQTRNAKGAVSLALFRAATELSRDNARQPAIIYARLTTYLNPALSEAQLMLGNLLLDESRFDLAIDAYRNIDAGDPLFEEAQLRLALAEDDAGREEHAIESLGKYLNQRPNSIEALITLGDIYRTKERYAEAAAVYTEAIEMLESPRDEHWFLFFTRGIAHEQTDQWDKAETDFKTALELFPDQPQVLNYLGYSWLVRGENFDQAMEMIARAVEQRPNDGFITDSLGWAHYLMGNYELAVKHLEQAVLLQPSDPTINDHLGDAYWQVGRHMEARYQWAHALDADPEPEVASQIREKLEFGPALAKVDQSE